MKTDKFIKDLSDRLNCAAAAADSNNIIIDDDPEQPQHNYDDQYYLDIGSEPPRFAYYRYVRAEKSDYDNSFTQDELDYALKRELRKSPEQRYQEEKRNWLFHDSCSYMRGLQYDDGYGCTGAGCIPECRFYADKGRIEDDEVREEYKKIGESLRRDNKIVEIEPPSKSQLLKFAKSLSFSLF